MLLRGRQIGRKGRCARLLPFWPTLLGWFVLRPWIEQAGNQKDHSGCGKNSNSKSKRIRLTAPSKETIQRRLIASFSGGLQGQFIATFLIIARLFLGVIVGVVLAVGFGDHKSMKAQRVAES